MRSRPRPSSSARAAESSAERISASRATRDASHGLRARVVLVHQRGDHRLIERAPVRADADWLFVLQRELDDRRELHVALPAEADVAGIDAVFRERFGAGRLAFEQLMAVVVEVADQRHVDAHHVEPLADAWHRGRGFRRVHRDAHELGSCARELGDLLCGAFDVGRVGVRHRLHDDRRNAADLNVSDAHRDGSDAPQRAEPPTATAPMSTATLCRRACVAGSAVSVGVFRFMRGQPLGDGALRGCLVREVRRPSPSAAAARTEDRCRSPRSGPCRARARCAPAPDGPADRPAR